MKKTARKKKINRYLKGKIESGECICCGSLSLITISGICLKCWKAVSNYLTASFGKKKSKKRRIVTTRTTRSVPVIPKVDFSPEEIAEMSQGAVPIKKRVKVSQRDRNFKWKETGA